MDKFVVTGIRTFDGEYPIDAEDFTAREYEIIKRMSGVLPADMLDAYVKQDNTFLLSLCVVAVKRAGRDWQAFELVAWDVPSACIDVGAGPGR